VTVLGPSLTWADVYATAAVVRGPADFSWLRDHPDYQALVVGEKGGLVATPELHAVLPRR
jgi:thiamine biosynthesis lipoprotein